MTPVGPSPKWVPVLNWVALPVSWSTTNKPLRVAEGRLTTR
jgi:hypothetical protein